MKTVKRTMIFVAIAALSQLSFAACVKSEAQKLLVTLTDPHMATINEEDGWVVVRFGSDYASWKITQRESIITAYANTDACIYGKARNMEFRSPSGKIIARADKLRGIQVY